MDIILLGITVVSLVVALVMSVAAWRLMRDEKAALGGARRGAVGRGRRRRNAPTGSRRIEQTP